VKQYTDDFTEPIKTNDSFLFIKANKGQNRIRNVMDAKGGYQ